MDKWPSDDRKLQQETRKSGKGKGKNKEEQWNYPVLEKGSLNAATLIEKDERLEWSTITRSEKRRLVAKHEAVKTFPATRTAETRPPAASYLQQAEQGAHFLRTHFPDVDVPAELIREEIASDVQISQQSLNFSPFEGNLVDILCVPEGLQKQSRFLAFPMGETNRDLNVSPFTDSGKEGTIFRPYASAVRSFSTPIEQIVASEPIHAYRKQSAKSFLAVRTFGSTSVLEVKVGASSPRAPKLQLSELFNVSRSDVADRHIVDVKFSSPLEPTVLMVNDRGAIYYHHLGASHTVVQQLSSPSADAVFNADDHLWRLTINNELGQCYLASSKTIDRLDFRSRRSIVPVFSFEGPSDFITATEAPKYDGLLRVATTSEVLWFDGRNTGKPLLGHKHGRVFDRTLDVRSVPLGPVPLTLLTSRKNNLITVYDVSADGPLVYWHAPPYSLACFPFDEETNGGYALFQDPSMESNQIELIRVSGRRGLHTSTLEFLQDPAAADDSPSSGKTAQFQWSEEMQELDRKADAAPSDAEPLARREFTEVELRAAYEKLFNVGPEAGTATEASEAVYELLEKMPYLWQTSDVPIEHAVTTFDVAFRSGEEPALQSRADFFTGSAISSTRGFRALAQGRLPIKDLAEHAAWHRNILPFARRFVPELSSNPEEMVNRLHAYDLTDASGRPGPSYRRESEAREQLALDLALSTDVFSAQPLHKPRPVEVNDAIETMSLATEAMSLSDGEPPPVQFGYLRPVPKGNANYYGRMREMVDDKAEEELIIPTGVRLLLKEWDVGTSPDAYEYHDPYGTDDTPRAVNPHTRLSAPSRAVLPALKEVQTETRPPTVVAAKSLAPPPIVASRPVASRVAGLGPQSQQVVPTHWRSTETGSQPQESMGRDIPVASSQDPIPNTQILAGPHGGRQQVIRKKPAKKRLGGF